MVNNINKLVIKLPTKILLNPYKQPCIAVKFLDNEIVWGNGKREEIKKGEINDFLFETKLLIERFGLKLSLQYFTNDIKPSDKDMQVALQTIKAYFLKWGCPIYTSNKSKINFYNLLHSTFSAYVFIDMWKKTNEYIDIFKNTFEGNSLNWLPGKPSTVKVWYLSPFRLSENDNLLHPDIKDYYGNFYLFFKQPTKNDLQNKLSDNKTLAKYIRANLLNSLSSYMKNRLITNIKLKDTTFELNVKSNDNFLLFLLYNLPELLQNKAKLCACGCGNLVFGKSNFLPGHIEKKRNSQFDRKLKARIRMMKNRNKISETLYKDLCNKIDSLVNQEISDNQIEEIINNEIAKEV